MVSHTERQSASGPSGPSGAPSTSLADMSSIGHAAWGLWWSHGAPSATMLGDVPTGALISLYASIVARAGRPDTCGVCCILWRLRGQPGSGSALHRPRDVILAAEASEMRILRPAFAAIKAVHMRAFAQAFRAAAIEASEHRMLRPASEWRISAAVCDATEGKGVSPMLTPTADPPPPCGPSSV